MIKKKMNVLSLFSGAGGLDLGFKNNGFHIISAIEFNKNFIETYNKNLGNHTICQDIQEVDNEYFTSLKGTIDGIIGGPPCQGFSLAGSIARNSLDDPRNYLFKRFLEIIDLVTPRFIFMENVANMLRHNKGKTIQEISYKLISLGYSVKYEVLNTKDYDVPQSRKRFCLVALKENAKEFYFPEKVANIYNIEMAIDDLPTLKSGESSSIPNHIAMNHTDQMLNKMSFIPEGGDRTSIPIEYRPTSGDQRKYIKLDRKKISYCVTGDMRKIFHYNQNRALTVRELARLQTFPDNFIFYGTSMSKQQQIGNAVPVKFAEHISKEILKAYDISNN